MVAAWQSGLSRLVSPSRKFGELDLGTPREMFNSFNHPNFQNPNATIGSPTAGVTSATYAARDQQVALKLNF
jgi:hypothetical protein